MRFSSFTLKTSILLAVRTAAAIAANGSALYLLNAGTVEATHFRPATCAVNVLGVWNVCYTTVDGDGLRVYGTGYKNTRLVGDLRIPEVFVDYGSFTSPDDFLDVLAHECGRVDQATYFVLYCRYTFNVYPQCGSYVYQEDFYFHSNGTVQPILWIYGPGYNFNHWYLALFHMDLDISGSAFDRFARYEFTPGGSGWVTKSVEGWYPDNYYNSGGFKSGYEWINVDNPTNRAAFIDPNDQDNTDPTTGPWFWATLHRPGETEGLNGLADVYVTGENIYIQDVDDWYTALKFNTACTTPVFPYLAGPQSVVPAGY